MAGTTGLSAHLSRSDASHLDIPVFYVLRSLTLDNATDLCSTLKVTEASLALKAKVFLFSFYLFSSKLSLYASRSTGELVYQAEIR